MKQTTSRPCSGHFVIAAVILALGSWAPTVLATTVAKGGQEKHLSCEQKDNVEEGCCCFQKSHTYEFEPMPVSRVEVTFDTGRGLGCRSQVDIELLDQRGWKTLRTVNAVSSDGRSQVNRSSHSLQVGRTISGVRIGDNGRCYIDYSKVAWVNDEDPPTPDFSPASGSLASGAYRLEAYSQRRHKSLWHLQVSGNDIVGKSEWDCCPGRRNDPLEGTVRGSEVRIKRSCGGQGLSGRCLQIYEGSVSRLGIVTGSWSHNGSFAGKWRLEPVEPTRPPAPTKRIIADPPPPYRELPVTVDFTLKSGPVADASWWMDGRRMTNADLFFWTFGDAGGHEIEVRDRAGAQIARLDFRLLRPTNQRVKIVPNMEPPFHFPASLTFRQEPRPVAGARWYIDDSYVSSQQTLTRDFHQEGSHEILLRSGRGEVLASYQVRLEPADLRLWGRRRRGPWFERSHDELRELELRRSARVKEVEGNAQSYCVWTVSAGGEREHEVVCGSDHEPIIGAMLLPGRYVVFPSLADDQRSSEVTIHLQSR